MKRQAMCARATILTENLAWVLKNEYEFIRQRVCCIGKSMNRGRGQQTSLAFEWQRLWLCLYVLSCPRESTGPCRQ